VLFSLPLCCLLKLVHLGGTQALLAMVREELGTELGEQLVPLENGGVAVHKIFGLMHDTCSTANLVAQLMAELRDEQARLFHGEEAWNSMDPCVKEVHDFLCGNHSRNLLVDRFNTFHDEYLDQELGKANVSGVRAAWEVDKCKQMLCHNNGAERPFAILRQYKRIYPSMSVENLGKLSNSLVNGTHRPALKGLAAGIALTADPRLKTCVGTLCSVRRVKVIPLSQCFPPNSTVTLSPFLPLQIGWQDHSLHEGCYHSRQKRTGCC
jgi:hypothetical protein